MVVFEECCGRSTHGTFEEKESMKHMTQSHQTGGERTVLGAIQQHQHEGVSLTSCSVPSGATVYLIDDSSRLGPEGMAMLQALYSRSSEGVLRHLSQLLTGVKDASDFMQRYYIGYGHKSIGDCGTLTLFVEDASMVAIKAIQAHPLYNGQEKSTRYIDFAEAGCIPPSEERWKQYQEGLMGFYTELYDHLRGAIALRWPLEEGVSESVWQNAVNAKALDIARGFLPAGARSSMSWTGEISVVNEHLAVLLTHPLEEVRHIALAAANLLGQAYPSSSFGLHLGHDAVPDDEVTHRERCQSYLDWFDPDAERYLWRMSPKARSVIFQKIGGNWSPDNMLCEAMVDQQMLLENERRYDRAFPIPKARGVRMANRYGMRCGVVTLHMLLDFGSARDLLRHRSLQINTPLVTPILGMHPWYRQQVTSLVPSLLNRVVEFESGMMKASTNMCVCDMVGIQYATPMGALVPLSVTGPLQAWGYVLELRSSRNVHPTLVRAMRGASKHLSAYLDLSIGAEPEGLYVNRGKQTIKVKEQ